MNAPTESVALGEQQAWRGFAPGRWQDAIQHYAEAERLDPINAINVGNAHEPLLYLKRCKEARAEVEKTLAIDPANLNRSSAHRMRCRPNACPAAHYAPCRHRFGIILRFGRFPGQPRCPAPLPSGRDRRGI